MLLQRTEVATRKLLMQPGWSTSCTNAEMSSAAIASGLSNGSGRAARTMRNSVLAASSASTPCRRLWKGREWYRLDTSHTYRQSLSLSIAGEEATSACMQST